MCGFYSSKVTKSVFFSEQFLSLATQACTCMAMETEYILPCFQDLRVPITVIFNVSY